MVHDRVVDFLRTNGPSQPVEISTKVGYDSFVMRAVLLELINKGLVKKSKRPIGGTLVYYLPEQVNQMRKRLYDDLGIPDKKVLDKLEQEGQVLMSELSPHERAFIKPLLDFVKVEPKGDDYLVTHCSFKPSTDRTKVTEPEPKPPEIKPVNDRLFEKDSSAKKDSSSFDLKAQDYLKGLGEVTFVKKVKANSEYDYKLKISKPFPQELFVKAKKKKSITERDLSLVYAEALRQKKPSLIVTTGKLTKKAIKWKKENIGEMVKVVQIK